MFRVQTVCKRMQTMVAVFTVCGINLR